jgi:hypothetical protein
MTFPPPNAPTWMHMLIVMGCVVFLIWAGWVVFVN